MGNILNILPKVSTIRGFIRSRDFIFGTRGLARSSHPPRRYSLTRLHIWHSRARSQQPPFEARSRDFIFGTRGIAHSSHPRRRYSLTRLHIWHSGARSQQPPSEALFAY